MIECKDVAMRRGERLLFSSVTLSLRKGQKVGLVGANGAGKSTFFALILGQLSVDRGHFAAPEAWTIAHVEQQVQALEMSAIEYTLSGDAKWYELNALLANQGDLSAEKIAALHHDFEAIDGYRAPAKAAQILSGLGFGQDDHQKSVASFSGGWRMRLNLARALMTRSDALLLDEPTNHLDLDAILWLEEWLFAYDGLLVVISHDRAFLDAVVDRVLHIDRGSMTLYSGNYSQFERAYNERLAQERSAYAKQQETRAHLEDFVRRFGAKASKARQAQSRLKQLQKMQALPAALARRPFAFRFFATRPPAAPLISLKNADIGYRSRPVLKNVNWIVHPDTRLGVLGENGAGKSTLIKALVGDLPLLCGERAQSENLRLGYFHQHQIDAIDLDASPSLLLQRLDDGSTPASAQRAFLGGFGFGDKLDCPARDFSGGELARLSLALIVWQRPNALILDEPTNHLDVDMQRALSVALQDFDGAVILVSHDRELILDVCDTLALIEDGVLQDFDGDMQAYSARLQKRRKEKQNALASPKDLSAKNQNKDDKRKQNAALRQKTAPLRKKIADLESKTQRAQDRLAQIAQKLSDGALYNDDRKDELLRLIDEEKALKAQTAADEEAWFLLVEELDRANAGEK